MKMNVCILMLAVAVVGVSCLPSRQRRQFDWTSWENVPTNNVNDWNSQINSNEVSTTQGTTTTTMSQNYRQCLNVCPRTFEYNPVCGTDGVTYTNRQTLNCARSCGQNVSLQRGGTCQPL
ncbi:uncharacterized protein LOC130900819 [Diorhabda carinulata]|uniref:uncharacterized protein LOC130900819 n=1 Tax=Diorhabda carinulata TaxID=1163345 RepID=UPI0025A11A50|nr:uncharacterized protein LOC130900819 [Diorhabda carinulata]